MIDFIFRCGAILGLTFGELYSLIFVPKKEIFPLLVVMFITIHVGYQIKALSIRSILRFEKVCIIFHSKVTVLFVNTILTIESYIY